MASTFTALENLTLCDLQTQCYNILMPIMEFFFSLEKKYKKTKYLFVAKFLSKSRKFKCNICKDRVAHCKFSTYWTQQRIQFQPDFFFILSTNMYSMYS